MNNILLIDETDETKNILIKYLQRGGFEVISKDNGLVSVHIRQEKSYIIPESKKSNSQKFIFPSTSRLRKVFEFIELNYHQPIRLKEVAQAVGYSPAYLTDLVRKLTGTTVNDWIIRRRIAEACNLLLKTNCPVNEIALEVGYQNINLFYSQFRNYYNNTPKAWREAQRYTHAS
jgi:AraC family transcriptional regulator